MSAHDPSRKQRVYHFIIEHSRKHLGNFPTLRDIMAGCGVSSTSEAHRLLGELEKDGTIFRLDHVRCVAGATWLAPVVAEATA